MEQAIYGNEKQIKRKQRIRLGIVYAFITFFAILIIIPFYWMLITSVKTMTEVQAIPPILWLQPWEWSMENFSNAMERAPFVNFIINTVVVAIIATVGTIITTILTAFAFARLNFKGRDILFMVFIATMMLPGEIFVITNFITVSSFGWVTLDQTYLEAILTMTLPFMTSIFFIFFLRQAFKQIPDELYYAAKVDGKTDWQYLWRVMVPIAIPTITTITILNAMNTWNAYIWPQLVTQREEFRLVSNGLRNAGFELDGRMMHNEQMAAAIIVTVPLLIVFILLKKYIMRGVSRSGIKG